MAHINTNPGTHTTDMIQPFLQLAPVTTLDSDKEEFRQQRRGVTHIMSVDVEDYFQVEAFADSVPRHSWEEWPSRVVANTQRVLDLFDQYDAKGTFFFLGWVAKRFPSLVREVQTRGHELACHSFWHRPVYSLTPEEFREDTRASRDVIEQAGGDRVLGYRAPSWSITRDSLWALDVLADEGFTYDSSIFPIHHDLYGIPGAQRFVYAHPCQNGQRMIEVPPATVRFPGFNFPAAGGGYLRLFPYFYTDWVFQSFERSHKKPVMVYFHPWEIDPEQPRSQAKLKSRFRHYTNIGRMEKRLQSLLRTRSFQSIRDTLIQGESLPQFSEQEPQAAGLQDKRIFAGLPTTPAQA
jgi:polysaccharide deacetylase family protein (PEP-CTERM system associated)